MYIMCRRVVSILCQSAILGAFHQVAEIDYLLQCVSPSVHPSTCNNSLALTVDFGATVCWRLLLKCVEKV
jgi:hypothetical protein